MHTKNVYTAKTSKNMHNFNVYVSCIYCYSKNLKRKKRAKRLSLKHIRPAGIVARNRPEL